MIRFKEYGAVAAVGAVGYTLLEILWRGHTHWSMTVTGGICLPLVYMIHSDKRRGLIRRSLDCALVITAIEFAVGVLVNIMLRWNVWDYSERKFNVLGQICPQYSVLWCLLSAAICPLCNQMKKHFR